MHHASWVVGLGSWVKIKQDFIILVQMVQMMNSAFVPDSSVYD